eukprot:Cvel_20959.t1-p1 / transcript=Cvel_20959.t1 / gene=Cvel_20959 / organism=Chromera_velia_CCMP2878 / gene_product=hypothetical protein / transcript_product=hypothetical protein / location=Cvel_scaffold1926:35356-36392(+) / protein_length=256 / sequence_SO=supercontig / SO=protein_coding / is_pseudo=false
MSKPVDYSKWDKLDVSDSEDEGPKRPQVTAFRSPQRITIPPRGEESENLRAVEPPRIQELPPESGLKETAEETGDADGDGDGEEEKLIAEGVDEEGRHFKDVFLPASEGVSSTFGSKVHGTSTLCENGGREGEVMWSQARHEVTVTAEVPEGTRARQVDVKVKETHLSISLDGVPLVEGDLCHRVEEDEDEWQWELVSFREEATGSEGEKGKDRRGVQVCLRKKYQDRVGSDVTVWWTSLLRGNSKGGAADLSESA